MNDETEEIEPTKRTNPERENVIVSESYTGGVETTLPHVDTEQQDDDNIKTQIRYWDNLKNSSVIASRTAAVVEQPEYLDKAKEIGKNLYSSNLEGTNNTSNASEDESSRKSQGIGYPKSKDEQMEI